MCKLNYVKRSLLCWAWVVLGLTASLGQTNGEEITHPIFDSLISPLFPDEGPGGTLLLAKKGNIIYQRAFGKANLELDVDMKIDHVFAIASITKVFTAAAILRLKAENQLTLDDELAKFIPDYPRQASSITIEHLLTHSSGIANYTELDNFTKELDYSDSAFMSLFDDKPLAFPPGTRYAYNNSDYWLLGYIIEKVTQQPYGSYLDQTFFQPLGMDHTSITNYRIITPHKTDGYFQSESYFNNVYFISNSFAGNSAGGLQSTVGDVFLWCQALLEGNILSQDVFQASITPYKLTNGSLGRTGYGWFVGNLFGSSFICHDGSTIGYYSSLVIFPEEEIIAIVLTNCNWNHADEIIYAPFRLASIELGKAYQNDIQPPNKLTKYEGIYKAKGGASKSIIAKNGQLRLVQKNGRESLMYKGEEGQFYVEDSFETIIFKRNSKGEIDRLISTIGESEVFFR